MVRRSLFAWSLVAVLGCGDIPSPQGVSPPPARDGVDSPAADVPTMDATTPEACDEDADCDGLDGCCHEGQCRDGVCQVRFKPDCCEVEGPCASTSALHTASCVETCVDGGCQRALRLGNEGCDQPIYHLEMTPAGFSTLAVVDFDTSDRVNWHLSSRRGLAGGDAIYAGDVLCPTYYDGMLDAACRPVDPTVEADRVALSLETPSFELPPGIASVATVWLWLDLESRTAASGVGRFDGLEIVAIDGADVFYTRWSSRQGTALSPGMWHPVLVDLSDLAGRRVRLRVDFDTIDGRDNHHEGVYIGAIDVATACEAARSCSEDGPCEAARLVEVAPIADTFCVTAPPDPGVACQPCAQAADCVALDACDVTRCEAGRCTSERQLTASCCAPLDAWPGPAGFESALGEGWLLEASGQDVGWHLSPARAETGGFSLRFGDLNAPRLAPPGEAASGTIWSPPLRVPPDAPQWRFSVWASTEWDAAPDGANPSGVDLLEALVRLETTAVDPPPEATIWDSRQIGGTTSDRWEAVTVDLSVFEAQTIRVGWRFDTRDEASNDAEGIYIDSPAVSRRCPACGSPEGCAPGGGIER